MQSRSYTVIILGTEVKRFAVYTAPTVGRYIQSFLTDEQRPRPFTHDLINGMLKGFEIKPLHVVINDIEDTIYFSRVFFEQQKGNGKTIVEIDARPSDSITLSLMHNIPVFCKREIYEKAVAVEE